MRVEWLPADHWSTSLLVAGGANRLAQPAFLAKTRTLQARPSARWTPFKTFTLELGADYLLERLTGTLRSQSAVPAGVTGTLPIHFGPNTTYDLAAFLKAEWNVGGGLALLPGLRLDYFKRINETVADPRLLVRYEFLKGLPGVASLAAKAGIGVYRQPPSQLETISRIGNPDLSAQQAMHYLGGLEYRPTRELLVDVACFYVSQEHVIVSTTETVTRNGTQQQLTVTVRTVGAIKPATISTSYIFLFEG